MEFDTPEKLRAVFMECLIASCREFRADLERRIAVRLYMKLPQATVINMAQTVSAELGEYFTDQMVASGQLERTLDKLL